MYKSYHNTTNLKGEELTQAETKAMSQEEMILDLFKLGNFSPSNVWKYFNTIDWIPTPPITSIRRAITNLEKQGKLIKTGRMKPGIYGRPENIWKLKDNQINLFK